MLEGISRRDFPIVQATVLAAGFFTKDGPLPRPLSIRDGEG
jgi:hypothetical protein